MTNHTDAPELPDHLFDGFHVHRAVLEKGLAVLALPRQVLLAGAGAAVPAQISFSHGVPEGSTLSGVTFAQDQRLRRALLQRAGVQVPRGATFTWRSLESAQEWVKGVGFPVLVKDAMGENPSRAIRGITDDGALREAFQAIRRRRPEDRSPGSNPHIAGYAATRLGYTLDDEGNEVAPLHTRMLVEKQIPGVVVRAAVVGGDIVAAIHHAQDGEVVSRPFAGELSEAVRGVIIKAAEAIPGLALAIVDVAVDSPSNFVVEVGERPRLASFGASDSDLPDVVARAIVAYQASLAGLSLGEDLEEIAGELTIDGLRSVTEDSTAILQAAGGMGVALSAPSTDVVAGRLSATVKAAPGALALFVEMIMAGELIDDKAMSVEYRNDETDV